MYQYVRVSGRPIIYPVLSFYCYMIVVVHSQTLDGGVLTCSAVNTAVKCLSSLWPVIRPPPPRDILQGVA